MYEYKRISNTNAEMLNTLAKEGWELITESEYHYTLKRLKSE